MIFFAPPPLRWTDPDDGGVWEERPLRWWEFAMIVAIATVYLLGILWIASQAAGCCR